MVIYLRIFIIIFLLLRLNLNLSAQNVENISIKKYQITDDSVSVLISNYIKSLHEIEPNKSHNSIILTIDSLESCLIFQLEYYKELFDFSRKVNGFINIDNHDILIFTRFNVCNYFEEKGETKYKYKGIKSNRSVEEESEFTKQIWVCDFQKKSKYIYK